MGECAHPRSQRYTDDQNRGRCGACGDVWDNDKQMFVPIDVSIEKMEPYVNPPRVIVIDERNGRVYADGSNIDLPVEGQLSALRSLETADVIVEIHEDGVFVTTGFDKHIVLLLVTKSVRQLSAEKAEKELHHRTDNQADDLVVGEHPVTKKFARVWDGSVESGTPEERGLKGY